MKTSKMISTISPAISRVQGGVHDATFAPDISVVLKETLPTLERAVRDGKARYIGLADYDIDLMKEIIEETDVRISSVLSYAKSTLCDDRLQNYTKYFKFTTSFDLGGVMSGNRMAGVPLGRSLGNGEIDVEGICSEPGMTCLNCTHAITCVPLPVGYLKVPLQKCTGHQSCNAHLGGCSDTPVPECEDTAQMYSHTCEQVGIFPDAYDCRKFHLCSPPEGLPFGRPADHRTALCPRHYGYNPQTAQCSIKLHKGQCSEKHVPTCSVVGELGPLITSPNHYYVCLQQKEVLYPQVFLCPHGWFFWDNFCHSEQKPEKTAVIETTTEAKIVEKSNLKDKQVIFSDKSSSKTSEEKSEEASPSNSWLENFFSTEKATTYAADAFLADKFDLTNYETTDDQAAPPSYDYGGSFESW